MKGYRDIAGDGGSNIVEQVVAQQARLAARMAPIRASVAVVSGKGGVGKSSVTANLAGALAQRGLAVGVLDADLNGPSMGKMLGVRGQTLRVEPGGVCPAVSAEGIRVLSMDLLLPGDDTPVVWDAPTQAEAHTWRGTMEGTALREFLADTAWGALDVLLLDLPPGTDRLATIASLVPALSGIVIVTIPSDVSHLVVRRSITVAANTRAPMLGLVENMAGLFAGPDAAKLAADAGIPFLGSVPFDRALAIAADQGDSFVGTAPERAAAVALRRIAEAIRVALSPRRA